MSAAFFDVDGTLVDVDAHAIVMRWLWSEAGPAARARLLAGAGRWVMSDRGEAANRRLKLATTGVMAGWSETFAAAALGGLVRDRVLPRLRPALRREVEAARRSGRRVVLLTASLAPVVAPIAEVVGADEVIAVQPSARGGVLDGGIVGLVPYGREKRRALQAWCAARGVEPARCAAWGDAWSDRHALAAVGEAAVVHPGRRLRLLAALRGWRIVDDA